MEQQLDRYTKIEKELIRKTFGKQPELLLLVRNFFLGFQLTENENTILQSVNTPAIRTVIKKCLYPEIEKETPIGLEIDVWMTFQIGSLQEFPIVYSSVRQTEEMVNMAFRYLETMSGPRPSIELPLDSNHSQLIARNMYITKIVMTGMLALRTIANSEDETPSQREKRLKKDSMK